MATEIVICNEEGDSDRLVQRLVFVTNGITKT